ncbi:hypothetical protein [Humidisolicoccus flavus]|uniref:hypothetical protein n=1 Tax=Humidisolicoccus flavus TaxID=3111414 RepID=UPI0032534A88
MNVMINAAHIELRRLVRSGLLMGLLVTFGFFGLSGPALAVFMPQILQAASGTEQITITVAEATSADAIALFNQSAMQLGLIFAVAVAITSLHWDSRPGSSIFYRSRLHGLAQLIFPRLLIVAIAVLVSYLFALVIAAVLAAAVVGPVDGAMIARVGASSSVFIVMALCLGFLVMTITRRTATSVAVATILVLVLPLLSSVPTIAEWVPTTLLSAAELSGTALIAPLVTAIVVSVGCLGAATAIANSQQLRRDS